MALLHLLKGTESISALRDRSTAAAMATSAILQLLKPLSFCWLRPCSDDKSLQVIARIDANGLWLDNTDKVDGSERLASADFYRRYPEARAAIAARASSSTQQHDGRFKIVLPFFAINAKLDSVLLAECREPLSEEQENGIFSFLQFYSNYLTLLDYGERDTLTGLHNRKTFDEALERLLTRQPVEHWPDDKRRPAAANFLWLAVLDIDNFKHINDSWGHLFGDETLLRFARLLKEVFRSEDQLFRFGGEEFVVIIRAASRDCAQSSFERFRTRLETTDFPQVGRISCSIGFTCLNPDRPAIDILGCADQALYFAKDNGRNQTHSYEALVESGAMQPHIPLEGDSAVDFDIDALFG